jgi:hypothetical protein
VISLRKFASSSPIIAVYDSGSTAFFHKSFFSKKKKWKRESPFQAIHIKKLCMTHFEMKKIVSEPGRGDQNVTTGIEERHTGRSVAPRGPKASAGRQ